MTIGFMKKIAEPDVGLGDLFLRGSYVAAKEIIHIFVMFVPRVIYCVILKRERSQNMRPIRKGRKRFYCSGRENFLGS